MSKRTIVVLCMALCAFGIGASATAKPANCQSCFSNYASCIATGGEDCGTNLEMCMRRLCR